MNGKNNNLSAANDAREETINIPLPETRSFNHQNAIEIFHDASSEDTHSTSEDENVNNASSLPCILPSSENNDNPDGNVRVTRSRATDGLIRPRNVPNWFWGNNLACNSQRNVETAFHVLNDEPLTLKDAEESPEWPKWKQAMNEEMNALEKNKTWALVDLPQSSKPVKCKWVFNYKLGPQGKINRYKARLVAKGYSQVPNIDYKETFAPVASMTTIRLLFAIACVHDMEIVQFDVKTAFLYGDLDETIYMDYPDGYPNPKNKVCRLIKSLYGLKQAPRQWNKKFDSFLRKFNLHQSQVDRCLYYDNEQSIYLAIYVDDGLAISKDKILEKLINYLKENFELKVMDCESYLGFQVERNRENKTIKLSQENYTEKVIERFGMKCCKPASTPEEVEAYDMDLEEILTPEYPFKQLVGSLLYLVSCTRPDIAHAVSVASRTSKPTHGHWNRLKRVLRYLSKTKDFGITFRWEKTPKLTGYSDADYANDVKTRQSTTGLCIMYCGGPVAWRCQRQSIITLSTTEAEYVAGCELVKEILPIRELLIEIKQANEEPTLILIDNLSTVRITNNESGQQRTKHIDIRSKWLTEKSLEKKITVKHISGDKQIADILTKPQHKSKFIQNRSLLLGTYALVALMSMVVGDRLEFDRADPLFFKPTQFQYFKGDTEFKIKLKLQNPCETYFSNYSELEFHNMRLKERCHQRFNDKTYSPLTACSFKNDTRISSQSGKNQTGRLKRNPFSLIQVGLILLAGTSFFSSLGPTSSQENIEKIAERLNKERELLDAGEEYFRHTRDTIQGIKNWSTEVERALAEFRETEAILPMYGALITSYESIFNEYNNIINSLQQKASIMKVSNILNTVSNETLWEEPAADWSSLFSCTKQMSKKSMDIDLHFNMPIRDPRIKILEAVALNFYNVTDPDKNTTCWMRYKGPKHVLVNSTNNCMTEIIEWATESSSVRSQMCIGQNDEIRLTESLWEADGICTSHIPLLKRRIQDKEVNGLHRVFCYPFNITVDNKTVKCPFDPFIIEGRKTYKIANMEHIGSYIERTIYKEIDIEHNEALMKQLKIKTLDIRGFNTSNMARSYENYYQKLLQIPKNFELTKNISGTLGLFGSIFSRIKDWFETLGIIIAVVFGILILIILAPLIEMGIIGCKIFKIAFVWWLRSATNIIEKLKGQKRNIKTKYWMSEVKAYKQMA